MGPYFRDGTHVRRARLSASVWLPPGFINCGALTFWPFVMGLQVALCARLSSAHCLPGCVDSEHLAVSPIVRQVFLEAARSRFIACGRPLRGCALPFIEGQGQAFQELAGVFCGATLLLHTSGQDVPGRMDEGDRLPAAVAVLPMVMQQDPLHAVGG